MVKSNIKLVTISDVIVTVMFQGLVENDLCETKKITQFLIGENFAAKIYFKFLTKIC